MSPPRAFRWFVWDGRYIGEPATEPTLYAGRNEPKPETTHQLEVELDVSSDVNLDDRISVRILSAQTFSARSIRPQLLRPRGQYVAVKLALKRIKHIQRLLILVHRMKHPHVDDDPESELLVYRQWFSAEQLEKALPAHVDGYFGRNGKPRKRGQVIGDMDRRLASYTCSLYRFSAWVAHDSHALDLDPRSLALPKESLTRPMCVSDRSAKTKRPAPRPPDERGRNLGIVDNVTALWETRRG